MHHTLKKDIISGVYKGGPMGALSHEPKFKQDENHEVIALKKNKKDIFKDVTRGNPWVAPSHEVKFKLDAKPRSDCSVRTEWVD